MPAARHKLCVWHIGRNIGHNVKDHAAQKSLGKMIYVSMSVTEWEGEWHSLVARHGFVDNVWVTNLFNRRERWAEAFFREWRGQSVASGTGYFTTTSGRKNSAPAFEMHMTGVEEDACMLFTYDIFIMIKSQILFEKQFVIVHRAPFPLTDTVVFYIAQYDRPYRRWSVEFQSHETNPLISCSCKQFESDGISCCHIFCVMKDQLMCRYPESLEKERWKKSTGDSTMASCFKVPVDNKAAQVATYSALVSKASKTCSNYSFSEEGFRVGMNELAKLVQSSIEFRVNPPVVEVSNLPPSNIVRDPQIARTKGMHGNPSIDTETGNTQEQRNCGNCNLPGHNKRTCKASAGPNTQ
ncbi:hypothetical protein ACLB2K_062871 [Fragaria x ananassa]